MSQYVTLDMNYTTYSQLCDAVEEDATHAEDFFEIQDWVHLVDFLEEEYERDRKKQQKEYETWKIHEELFRNNEIYHHEYFYRLKEVFDDYEDNELLKMDISEQDKFHLICELIDVFKKDSQ